MKHQPAGTLWKLSVFSGTAIPMDSFIKKLISYCSQWKIPRQLISKHPILVDFFRTHWDRNDPFFAENLLLSPRRIEVAEMNGFQGQRQGTRFLEGLDELTVTSSPPPSHPTWPLWYPRPSLYDSRLLFHFSQTLATFAQACLLHFPTKYQHCYRLPPPPTSSHPAKPSAMSPKHPSLLHGWVPFMTPTQYHFP